MTNDERSEAEVNQMKYTVPEDKYDVRVYPDGLMTKREIDEQIKALTAKCEKLEKHLAFEVYQNEKMSEQLTRIKLQAVLEEERLDAMTAGKLIMIRFKKLLTRLAGHD